MPAALIQSVVSLPESPFPPVGGLFIGLACVYAADFLASLKPDLPKLGSRGERALGFSISVQGSGSCTSYLPRH
jgi:hypothetical protein